MATQADYDRIGNYARMYNPDQQISRRHLRRTVPLEVLCLGYSRTGTMSMHKALQILGYPSPYHFSSFYDNISDCDMWLEAMDAKFYGKGTMPTKDFWEGLLGHCGAVTDMPCLLFGEELVGHYPEAKVVLVEREMESWYASWMSFCKNSYDPVLISVGRLDPWGVGRITAVGDKGVQVLAGFSRTYDEARVRSMDAYRHHYSDVRSYTPKERLLDFKFKDGWGPLCEFLGKPVPDVPFPHENEAKANQQSFKEIGQKLVKNILKNVIMATTVIGAPVAAFLWYRKTSH